MSKKLFINIVAVVLFLTANVFAQTSAFVYQGKLNDGAAAANGTYQFTFKMYDAAANGNQVGQTIADLPATVTNGIFSVSLDFGASSFNGAARYLEISVRLNNVGQNYTMLSPRQPITSTPYAMKSLNSDHATTATTANNSQNLGGVPAAQYTQTNDARLSDARTPTPFSTYYIQNGTTPQSSSNFYISGEGKANVFNATTQFNLNGNRILHLTGTDNTFAGFESGNSITTGSLNAFFGTYAGKGSTTGINNAFFGSYAGRDNATGGNNSFFGANAGLSNNGSFNAFFGSGSGLSNINGANNSYFGNSTGVNNSTGDNNSFFGSSAGKSANNSSFNSFVGSFAGEKTTSGAGNTFVGAFSGRENIIGFNNTFVGYKAGQTPTTGNSNVVIGYNASFANGVSNSIAIGANVVVNSSSQTVIGGNSVSINNLNAGNINANQITASSLYSYGNVSGDGEGLFTGKSKAAYFEATDFGNPSKFIFAEVSETLKANGLEFGTKNVGGNTPLCMRNSGGVGTYYQIIPCSSSIRYKENVQNYTRGLELLEQLRPVTFDWKSDGSHDVGFVAEEVNQVEPILNTFNSEGKIEGVRYAQVTTVLVNAVKEQQTQIERQNEQIKRQQEQIDALKKLVCTNNKGAEICQPDK